MDCHHYLLMLQLMRYRLKSRDSPREPVSTLAFLEKLLQALHVAEQSRPVQRNESERAHNPFSKLNAEIALLEPLLAGSTLIDLFLLHSRPKASGYLWNQLN